MIRFEWDPNKDRINQKKHGISFEEAKSVFYDENAIKFFDNYHSDLEDRFIMLGFSNHLRLLIACHCVCESDTVIRIISAREATKTEAKYYGG